MTSPRFVLLKKIKRLKCFVWTKSDPEKWGPHLSSPPPVSSPRCVLRRFYQTPRHCALGTPTLPSASPTPWPWAHLRCSTARCKKDKQWNLSFRSTVHFFSIGISHLGHVWNILILRGTCCSSEHRTQLGALRFYPAVIPPSLLSSVPDAFPCTRSRKSAEFSGKVQRPYPVGGAGQYNNACEEQRSRIRAAGANGRARHEGKVQDARAASAEYRKFTDSGLQMNPGRQPPPLRMRFQPRDMSHSSVSPASLQVRWRNLILSLIPDPFQKPP